MTFWFIDSLDALGGRAFTSFREARSDDGPLHENGGYFIAAPDFAPEPVASAATSWAATRGMFQLGLLKGDGEEIPFARLEDIVEFVRRAYLTGGGGDGGDGDVGPPELPDGGSPIDPPKAPDDQFRAGAAIRQLEAGLEKFAAASPRKFGEPGVPVTSHHDCEEVSLWSGGNASAKTTDDASLQFAGRIVLTELIRRFPRSRDDTSASRWSNAAFATGKLLQATGLIDEMLVHVTRGGANDFGRAVGEMASHWFDEPHLRAPDLRPYAFARLLGLTPAWQYVHPRYWPWHLPEESGFAHWTPGQQGQDHFSLLFVIPVPSSIGSVIRRASGEPSLGSLLSFVLGAPQAALEFGSELRSVLSLCLLASALIVAPDRIRHGSSFPDRSSARINELTSDALTWMIANLPSVALPQDLELLIGNAAAMRAGQPSGLQIAPNSTSSPRGS